MSDFVILEDVREELAGIAKKMVTPVRVTPDTAGAYFDSLRDMSRETLHAALLYCVENDGGQFFPSISQIREAARTLMAVSLGIPAPSEAWGMVLNAKQRIDPIVCEEGARIREAAMAGTDYFKHVMESKEHDRTCDICAVGSWSVVYAHNAVAMTVRLMGGPEAIHTGMPTADRARFLEAYKEIVEREIRLATQSPAVKGFVQASRARYELEVPKAVAGLLNKWSVTK